MCRHKRAEAAAAFCRGVGAEHFERQLLLPIQRCHACCRIGRRVCHGWNASVSYSCCSHFRTQHVPPVHVCHIGFTATCNFPLSCKVTLCPNLCSLFDTNVYVLSLHVRFAPLLVDPRCIEAASSLLREVSPCIRAVSGDTPLGLLCFCLAHV